MKSITILLHKECIICSKVTFLFKKPFIIRSLQFFLTQHPRDILPSQESSELEKVRKEYLPYLFLLKINRSASLILKKTLGLLLG